MSKDEIGQIWAGTSRGLMCFDSLGQNSITFNLQSGLENEFINGLLFEGDTAVWVSTDVGLSRIVFNFTTLAQQEKGPSIRNYQKKDGLSGNEFNRISFLKSTAGTYYFGGLNGINYFRPGPLFWQEKQTLFAW